MCGSSIKQFQFNQSFCQHVGIKSAQFNAINAIAVIFVAQATMASIAFLVYDAKSMVEYGAIFFYIITIVEAMDVYFIMLRKLEETRKFIENCEGFIEKSKRNTLVQIFLFNYFL